MNTLSKIIKVNYLIVVFMLFSPTVVMFIPCECSPENFDTFLIQSYYEVIRALSLMTDVPGENIIYDGDGFDVSKTLTGVHSYEEELNRNIFPMLLSLFVIMGIQQLIYYFPRSNEMSKGAVQK